MSDVTTKVREVVATSFGVDPDELNDATKARDVEGWDSLAHATLILRLQRIFGVRLDPAQANGAQDLGSLTSIVAQAVGRHG